MLGKASVIKTRNQVKKKPVHQERVFSFKTIPSVLPYKNSEKRRSWKVLQPLFNIKSHCYPVRVDKRS